MGQDGVSGRSCTLGDVWHRPSIATHPKSLFGPRQFGLSCALASFHILPDKLARRSDARLARAPFRPVKLTPINRDML
jgi:hypothetical protein